MNGRKNRNPRYRNICFTSYKDCLDEIFCFDDDNESYCIKESVSEVLSYLIMQKERCPTTLKIHWQGYCEFKDQLTLSQIKSIFDDNTLHIEPRRGTTLQAIEYCRKADTAIEGSQYE